MAFKLLTRMLGLAAVFSAIASVEAGPYGGGFHALRIRDYTPVQLAAPSCTELSIGQKATGARVCLSVSSGTLIVSYPAVAGWTYNETQVYIGTTPPTGTAPGQYAFRSNNGYCFVSADKRTASCSIPVTGFQGVCSGSYYIATHAHVESVVAEGMTPSGATGWGAGTCITSTCKPWAMYWTNPFTLICLCTSTQVFPPVTSTSTSYSTITSTSTSYSTITSTSTWYSTITSTSTDYSTLTSTPEPSYYTSTCRP